MTATAPLVKIARVCTPEFIARRRRDRRGKRYTVALECGHLDTANATEVRRGKVHCFDCYYGKPVTT